MTKANAATTFASTVGPFLIASNVWSAYREFSRRSRRPREASPCLHFTTVNISIAEDSKAASKFWVDALHSSGLRQEQVRRQAEQWKCLGPMAQKFPRGVVFARDEKGEILGQLSCRTGHSQVPTDCGYVHFIYVTPEWRGCGVAAKLQDYMVAYMIDSGMKRVRLRVTEANTRARRFYERCGWYVIQKTNASDDFPCQLDLEYNLSKPSISRGNSLKCKQYDREIVSAARRKEGNLLRALKHLADRSWRLVALLACMRLFVAKRAKVWTFLASATLHRVILPYDWNMSLYFSLRAIGLWWSHHHHSVKAKEHAKRSSPLFMTASGIYAIHCMHNFLVSQRADWVNPSYLKLWQKVLPVKYPRTELWIQDFSSGRANELFYPRNLCGVHRFKEIPHRMLLSLNRQLPLVAVTFALPVLMFKSQRLRDKPLRLVMDIITKCLRSSIVLTALPFLLTEFPCLYGLLMGAPADATPRADLLHTTIVSLATTGVFLAEPPNRLRMIVVYTYWRVCQSMMIRVVPGLRFDGEGELEHAIGALLTGVTACISGT